jgi:transmembrane sensor
MENDKTHASPDSSLIEKEAVAWFTRMNGKPTLSEKRAFEDWLKRSADHRQAYNEVGSLWGDLGVVANKVADKANGDLEEPLQKIKNFRRNKRKPQVGAVVAGCLTAFVVGSWFWLDHPNFIQNMSADYTTAKGERRTVTLADGSTILMDADTALDASLSATARHVHLLRGNAYFTVQHTGAPFFVEAGNGGARVLGTRFDVVLAEDDNVTVTLSKGSVEVSSERDTKTVVLKPGESVEYGRVGLGAVKSVNLEESTAWHQGRLIFNNARLADVLAQIERYRDGRIVVLGSAVRNRRVSGNISLENTETTLAAMQSSVGFRMTKLGGKIVLIGP